MNNKFNRLLAIIALTFLIILVVLVFKSYAQEIDIDAVIQIESSGDPDAYNNSSGARGLMQITEIVYKEFSHAYKGVKLPENVLQTIGHQYNTALIINLYVPEFNVFVGTWYLGRIKNHYCKVWHIPPTIDNILIGYNWGPGNLKKWYRSGANYKKLPKETRGYIKKYKKLLKK